MIGKNLASSARLACRKASVVLRSCRNALTELLGEPDEQSFGAADVAEPIRVPHTEPLHRRAAHRVCVTWRVSRRCRPRRT